MIGTLYIWPLNSWHWELGDHSERGCEQMLFTVFGEVGSPIENELRILDPAEENESMYTNRCKTYLQTTGYYRKRTEGTLRNTMQYKG